MLLKKGGTEDVSDQAVLARHERVLSTMRDRWEKLKKLKTEIKEIVGENAQRFLQRATFFTTEVRNVEEISEAKVVVAVSSAEMRVP